MAQSNFASFSQFFELTQPMFYLCMASYFYLAAPS